MNAKASNDATPDTENDAEQSSPDTPETAAASAEELLNAAEAIAEETAQTDQLESDNAEALDPIEQLTNELESAQAKATENWDMYLRAKAETDNAIKRAGTEVTKARKFALDKFAGELLSVADNLEMGLQAADGESASLEGLREGTELTLKQLITVFEKFAVVIIDPQGEKFDPQLHEAIAMQPSAEHEPNTVITVVQKGYTLSERLLRPARVIVASAPVEPSE